jgi:hypothetical protein
LTIFTYSLEDWFWDRLDEDRRDLAHFGSVPTIRGKANAQEDGMKPRYLAWLAGLASLAYAFWLVRASREDLDIWIGLGGWLLGFWFAASILNLGRTKETVAEEDEDDSHDELDDESEEEWEEEWDEE